MGRGGVPLRGGVSYSVHPLHTSGHPGQSLDAHLAGRGVDGYWTLIRTDPGWSLIWAWTVKGHWSLIRGGEGFRGHEKHDTEPKEA